MTKLRGSIWIDGTTHRLHFINEVDIEYYYIGTDLGVSAGIAGSLYMDLGANIITWITSHGHMFQAAAINGATPVGAIAGSTWIDGSRLRAISNAGVERIHHTDVAHTDGNSHGDSGPHTDSVHGDNHGDFHNDAHFDRAHGDSHTDSHTDFDDHEDHFDVDGFPHEDHSDHGDAHADVEHSDSLHSDQHNDSIHTDTHADAPHGDSGVHTDGAGGHLDTPHSDEPVLVGA